ncbi:hypothetical protein INT45_004603 [Circinella minor]|uniref:Uncharacterized protein n=1 Tax=Circinella minor TaxID=1195481 RepID=A0A8H7S1J1_9FUNG|nr:hypothetical protein INT45_004603 [Circinella minor]
MGKYSNYGKNNVQREAMDSLGAAVRPMKEILDALVHGESSPSTPQQQQPIQMSPTTPIHHYFAGVFSSSTPPQEEPEIPSHKNFNELNVEAQLYFISYKKLMICCSSAFVKNDLDYLNNAIIKLSLSRIVNLIEPKLKQSILSHLNNTEKERLQDIFTPPSLPQLEEETQRFLLSIKSAAEIGDLDTVLSLTLERKLECVKARSTSSQLYQCISCLHHILSLIGSWDQEAKESEITFYRRSATILDYIFKNTGIILNENTTVELSSNERKRSSVSESMKLQQQSKNLRVNSAILNDMRKYDVQETMAMDWIACFGYLYSLKWVAAEEIYVATLFTDIHVSTGITLLYDDMLRMMAALFGFKHMLSSTARKVKGKIQKNKRKRKLPIPNEDTPPLATLAAATEDQQKRPRIIKEDEDDDNNDEFNNLQQ